MEIYNTVSARPSMPAAFGWASACATGSVAVQASVLGAPAVSVRVRTAPIFGFGGASGITSKINYIGKAASLVMRDHSVQLQLNEAAKGVKVTDARGIPPRGKPV